MQKLLPLFTLLLLTTLSHTQTPTTYSVAYSDTTIYCEGLNYTAYNYAGAAPLFVQIWHPVEGGSVGKRLTYGELRMSDVPEELKGVYAALNGKLDTAFIDYNIAYTVDEEEDIDYGGRSLGEVLDSLKTFPTQSYYAALDSDNDFPVIVYHHGAQSVADENFVMAEYFASRGYIFVSANFHLPYNNMPIGGAPFLSEQVFRNDQMAVKQLIEFSRSLTHNNQLFFMGHSWGAQSGWCLLHEEGWADAFVSLETTLEDKTDTVKIKSRWPEMYAIIHEQKAKYALPILLLAGTETDEKFHFFEVENSKPMYYVSTKTPFYHNSFTSVFLMRYYFQSTFKQPDIALLENQIQLYHIQMEMIYQFFESVRNNEPFDTNQYVEGFYIN